MPGKRYEAFNVENGKQAPAVFDISSFTKTIAYYETAGYLIETKKYNVTPIADNTD